MAEWPLNPSVPAMPTLATAPAMSVVESAGVTRPRPDAGKPCLTGSIRSAADLHACSGVATSERTSSTVATISSSTADPRITDAMTVDMLTIVFHRRRFYRRITGQIYFLDPPRALVGPFSRAAFLYPGYQRLLPSALAHVRLE